MLSHVARLFRKHALDSNCFKRYYKLWLLSNFLIILNLACSVQKVLLHFGFTGSFHLGLRGPEAFEQIDETWCFQLPNNCIGVV